MKKEDINQYPDGFLEEFKEPVTFKLLGVVPDKSSPTKGAMKMPSMKQIPPASTVSYKEETLTIALVKSVDPSGNVVLDKNRIVMGRFNDGQIRLDPSRPKDIEAFKYLNHCQYNQDSPYTYEGAKHYFYKFDLEKEAGARSENRKPMREAYRLISNSNSQDILSVYRLIGSQSADSTSIELIIDELEERATSEAPKIVNAFKKVQEAKKNIPSEVLIKEALDKKVIKKSSGQLQFNNADGGVFFKYLKKADSELTPEEQLEVYLDENKDKTELLKQLIEVGSRNDH